MLALESRQPVDEGSPSVVARLGDDEPIRAEVLGQEGLEQHARRLAADMESPRLERGKPLLAEFKGHARRLRAAWHAIRDAYHAREPLGHDAEWILDNYHIISEALTEVRTDLPHGYYRWLPKLTTGPLEGYPRVYALALELTAHCDSLFDEANLVRFIEAFQSETSLTVGELWAVPIMLRLCLVDNLRRLAEQVVVQQTHRNRARDWVSTNLAAGVAEPDLQAIAIAWRDCYAIHLLEGAHDLESASPDASDRVRKCLESNGITESELLARERRRQAANQVSIGNCVTSLRLLSATDWSKFFERTSAMEAALRRDPAGVYPKQDFATRDRYRVIAEHIARRSKKSEAEVTDALLAITKAAEPTDWLRRHVGYFLVDKGRPELERILGYRTPFAQSFRRLLLRHPNYAYFGMTAAFTACLTALMAWGCVTLGLSAGLTVLLAALAVLPLSDLAVGILNLLVPAVLTPRVLPRIDYRDGVPEGATTFVVVPSLLTSPDGATALVERLEIHYLSNPDDSLYFALLTDFADAPTDKAPADAECLRVAVEGINCLNAKYAGEGGPKFFLFHRKREWNPVQNCWMGWERKRGKLAEFNHLIRSGDRGTFETIVGDPSRLPYVRYVITLDADTQLPREAARKLIATMHHPLNRAVFDPENGRVVRGYGILQPRVSLSLRGARKSLFARVFTGSAGLDPYTTAVSDTYQDLFGSGSFTGKGIYDLDAFEAANGRRFPENTILSHDLIEGNFARCGLVSDVELLDDFPVNYRAYSRREHRWVRGDWQIMSWALPKVPAPGGKRPNNLPALERWKIIDNLRRSLVPPAIVVLLVTGWTLTPVGGWCSAVAALVIAWPLVSALLAWPFRAFRRIAVGITRMPVVSDLGSTASQVAFAAVVLLDQARNMADAILRTLHRLLVSQKNLLEWETAADAERRLGSSLIGFVRSMLPTSLLAVAIATMVAWIHPANLLAATPFALGWFLSPLVAWSCSRPRKPALVAPAVGDRVQLRHWARKTWRFFEKFVTADDHWLPPDNFQEDPKGVVAHRTSPTNIGLYLVSCTAAHDMGYLTWPALLDRIEKTLGTMRTMERSHGHFYNWYDTHNLAALHPIYLSTVDSGNLAASLVVLKQTLIEKLDSPCWGRFVAEGLHDTFELVVANSAGDAAKLKPLENLLAQWPDGETGAEDWLGKVTAEAVALRDECERYAPKSPEGVAWADVLLKLARERQEELRAEPLPDRERAKRLAAEAEALADEMDFRLLYNRDRDLFAVGYNLTAGRIDSAHYDLLASEAGLTSYLAVARGDVPRKHWFQLGRPLTRAGGSLCLLSWGGTMFEYLMPRLFLPLYPETLLDQSHRAAVAAQEEYGRKVHKPWGISESAYAVTDGDWNYQYQAFGAPGLGLKRGLAHDLVVAPYATGLAVMVDPHNAAANCRRLRAEGGEGAYGMFEAIDYTVDRLPPGKSAVVVKCYMAHHQGMTLIALANALLGDPFPRRFRAEPMVRASELLLQERVPRDVSPVEREVTEVTLERTFQDASPQLNRRINTPHTAHPRTHLLASDKYSVMLTNAGSGQSWAGNLAVTRWREDRTCDAFGQYVYVRDLGDNRVWSAGYQPVCAEPDSYEVTYAADKASIRRVDDGIETLMEVTVSPENHAEVRRITLMNHNHHPHELQLTSYAEIVLASQAADLAHPAFGKLFVETEYVAAAEALLCRRRPRSPEEKPIWALHVMAHEGTVVGDAEFETDRARFVGRGRTMRCPAALDRGVKLSGTTGPVLDAVFSLRRTVRIEPESSVSLVFTTAVAETREQAIALADQYRDYHGVGRAFEMAWAHSQVELRQIHVTAGEAHLYQRLASHLIYVGPALRASDAVATNRQGQPALWKHGISGDLPIALVSVAGPEEIPLVRQVVAAHALWRRKGLRADLVILNEQEGGYLEEFQQQILAVVRSADTRDQIDKPGGVFVRKATHVSAEDRTLFRAVARCVLEGKLGSLASQLERRERQLQLHKLAAPKHERPSVAKAPELLKPLEFDNGFGGFLDGGREYVIRLPGGGKGLPPAPWINVIANPNFGTTISESGGGFTWSGNSQSNRLTPWQNDPVSDPPGETIYLHDEETGETWSATPRPANAGGFLVRHGQGYTSFEQVHGSLSQELLVFVPTDDPVKLSRLTLKNSGDSPRRLTVAYFVDWVLGKSRDVAAAFVVTEADLNSGILTARSACRPDYAERVAFADISIRPRTFTADRTEFLGRNGDPAHPAAMERRSLSGRAGAALDSCAALQAAVDVPPHGEVEVVFLLGDANDKEHALRLGEKYRDLNNVRQAFDCVRHFWEDLLSRLQIETPDRALNLLFNRWLLYQTLVCRMWARSALYQSGGAYGFRDQLQDSLALVYAKPDEAQEQILRAASRQFPEGDVQHWWHPPSGAGVRTRFSDDYLWLPFAVEFYVRVTGDASVLDERVHYLDAPTLPPDREDDYRVPTVSDLAETVYEHCLRAIGNGLKFGTHGLPLMGTGDWNDGMNRVGFEGRGESVWTGWFLLKILRDFSNLCEARGDREKTDQYRATADKLRESLEENAWDGEWYRRAYFDDGTPLGSFANEECKIDSIAQSWAVICGAGDPSRARRSMDAADKHLVQRDDRMVLLFEPPFDHGPLQPGYIKGYLPGIRENGGQYTHAALWVAQAFAELGDGNRAGEVLSLLNPVTHGTSPEDVAKFKVEPYVVTADVYSQPPHVGRGGWSWYTGSAGWFYRVVLESLLGFRKSGTTVRFAPAVPALWEGFVLVYRYGSTTYRFKVNKKTPGSDRVELVDDGGEHEVAVFIPTANT